MWHEIFAGVYFADGEFCVKFAGTNFCDRDRLNFLDGN